MSDSASTKAPLVLTIREASEATGMSEKALRRRVERGTLDSLIRPSDGLRAISRRSLIDAKLLSPSWPDGAPVVAPEGDGVPRGTPQGQIDVGALLDRLEAQAQEVGRLKALTTRAESVEQELRRAQEEIIELRARLSAAEQRAEVEQATMVMQPVVPPSNEELRSRPRRVLFWKRRG